MNSNEIIISSDIQRKLSRCIAATSDNSEINNLLIEIADYTETLEGHISEMEKKNKK